MIKLLLTTTSLSVLFFSPAFGMDSKPSTPPINRTVSLPSLAKASSTLKRNASGTDLPSEPPLNRTAALPSSSKSSPTPNRKKNLKRLFSVESPVEKCENQAEKFRKKAAYHLVEHCVCLGHAALYDAAAVDHKYPQLLPKSKKGSVEVVPSTIFQEADTALLFDNALQEKKKHLNEAKKNYEEALKLGNEKVQHQLAYVFRQLSKIDPEYEGPAIQLHIAELSRNARNAGSDLAITDHFILGTHPSKKSISKGSNKSKMTISEESDKSKETISKGSDGRKQRRKTRYRSQSDKPNETISKGSDGRKQPRKRRDIRSQSTPNIKRRSSTDSGEDLLRAITS